MGNCSVPGATGLPSGVSEQPLNWMSDSEIAPEAVLAYGSKARAPRPRAFSGSVVLSRLQPASSETDATRVTRGALSMVGSREPSMEVSNGQHGGNRRMRDGTVRLLVTLPFDDPA